MLTFQIKNKSWYSTTKLNNSKTRNFLIKNYIRKHIQKD